MNKIPTLIALYNVLTDPTLQDSDIFNGVLIFRGAGIAQSLKRLATGWTVRGSNPGWGGEIFRTRPARPWGPPSLPTKWVQGLSPGGKEAGALC
jgi:hypothetical protein